VTNLNDAGLGSLRQAILDTPAGGTVDFQPGLSGTITLSGGELAISKDLTIAGPGADVITVSGNGSPYRVFNIAATFTVAISGLTIANGRGFALGGGIMNNGALTITNSAVSGNVTFSILETGGVGGGIYNHGALTVANSSISGNVASGGLPGGYGGGIASDGELTITNSTVSRNRASGLSASGGGISGNGRLTITNSTVSGNAANVGGYGDGGGISGGGTLRNTLIAGNTADRSPDLSGGFTSQGHNLIGDGSGGSGLTDTDLVGTAENPIDPLLGPLQYNGGPTLTMAPLPGSPAVDAGDNTDPPAFDQRGPGYDRIVGGVIDIGAFEVQIGAATHLAVSAPAGVTSGAPFDVTVTALDAYGHTATGYTGTVTFTSLDPYGASLPADYPFQPTDAGMHTFAAGATLYTAGTWDVAATDTTSGITGSAYVNVAAAPAVAFRVTAPASATAGVPFDFTVTAIDPYGNTDTHYTGTVVFSTLDPAGSLSPTGYTFQPGDMGMATFPMGATLNTAGYTWDVTATDAVSGITGSAFVTGTGDPQPSANGSPAGLAPPGVLGTPAPVSTPAPASPQWGRPTVRAAAVGP
jgi:hypothetical protein